MRVLLVDDDEDTRDVYVFALQEAGADVRASSNAKEAIRTVLAWPPDVIVSDLAMPMMDGFSLLREIRSIPNLQHVPAIAVTGLAFEQERAAALQAGFQEHAAKPLVPRDLVAIVARWAFGAGGPDSA